ncbi:MAG: thermonuclease family protein [Rhodobiaceae bacterium]|nr:thermonuclease family protein [Rhodobiaceae bacterium]MCC0061944.1 thermonuclease family protein [Rhodobiaceae bacterium]
MSSRALFLVATVIATVWLGAGVWLWQALINPWAGMPEQVAVQAPAPEQKATPMPEPQQSLQTPVFEKIKPSRNVTPPDTLPWPTPQGLVERLPADPLPLPPPEPPKAKQITRVVVEDARTLISGDETIRIAGIETRNADERCRDADGYDWPCGQAAITELRMLVRGRSVDCAPLPEGAPAETPRRCDLAGTDLAEWLLRQGWGTPAPGAPEAYREAHEEARKEKRGEYGKAWGRTD